MTLGGKVHFGRVSGNERVEEGVVIVAVVLLTNCGRFRAQNAPETLRFLSTGSSVGGYLNDDVRFGNIDGVIANFGEEDGVDLVGVFEGVQNARAFGVTGVAVNERSSTR